MHHEVDWQHLHLLSLAGYFNCISSNQSPLSSHVHPQREWSVSLFAPLCANWKRFFNRQKNIPRDQQIPRSDSNQASGYTKHGHGSSHWDQIFFSALKFVNIKWSSYLTELHEFIQYTVGTWLAKIKILEIYKHYFSKYRIYTQRLNI